MSKRVIPVELETGIPLPLEPNDNLPPVGRTDLGGETHHAIYPRRRPELQSPEGQVVRGLCLEWVDEIDHDRYHNEFDNYMANEWAFPKSGAESLGMTILYAAQYTPPQAIRMTRRGPRYVDLGKSRRQQLWDSGILRCGSQTAIGNFIMDNLVEQNLIGLVSESEVERFIYTEDKNEKLAIGNKLMSLAVQEVVEPIRPTYINAYKRRLIMPGAYSEPKRLILKSPLLLGTENRQSKVREALRSSVAAQYKVSLKAA